jgi:hypothetical protein
VPLLERSVFKKLETPRIISASESLIANATIQNFAKQMISPRPLNNGQQPSHWNPKSVYLARRIQQYGPHLDKPYAFCDWVNEARTTIADRGETPVLLIA